MISLDIIGKRFGKLTVISINKLLKSKYKDKDKYSENSMIECICDCGNKKIIKALYLINEEVKSCGCLRKELKTTQNFIGKKFGRLTVVSLADPIKSKTGKLYYTFNCLCDCGNYKIIERKCLLGTTKSCGCLKQEIDKGTSISPGTKFGKLTVISYVKGGYLKCICECGRITMAKSHRLFNGTKSCKCAAIEASRKYNPRISSARKVYRQYLKDGYCNLSFDQFYDLSQQNCHYCGISPSNEYNVFTAKSTPSTRYSEQNGSFTYNGLDRIDNLKYHTLDNVVPCCEICNKSKRQLSTDSFLNLIDNLKIKEFKPIKVLSLEMNNKYIKKHIKDVFKSSYIDSDLSLEEFYWMSQQNCFYCGSVPSNFKKTRSCPDNLEKTFIYNGLDRIDSSFTHSRNNIVPCCKNCNFSKRNLSLQKFNEWIYRIQKYQKERRGG